MKIKVVVVLSCEDQGSSKPVMLGCEAQVTEDQVSCVRLYVELVTCVASSHILV